MRPTEKEKGKRKSDEREGRGKDREGGEPATAVQINVRSDRVAGFIAVKPLERATIPDYLNIVPQTLSNSIGRRRHSRAGFVRNNSRTRSQPRALVTRFVTSSPRTRRPH